MREFEEWYKSHKINRNAFEWYPKSSMQGIAQEAFRAGMLAAAEIAELGSSLTPQVLSKASIRLRIANCIRLRAEL